MAELKPISERWLPVVGYEGVYEVSDRGNLRSLDRAINCGYGATRKIRGQAIRGKIHPRDGHKYASLSLNGVESTAKVHRLVLAAFVGPCPSGQVVRHLNGDPADNRLENLAYGTSLDNSADQRRHGTHGNTVKTHCPRGHEYTPENTRRYAYKSGRVCRFCISCERERGARRTERRRAARSAK